MLLQLSMLALLLSVIVSFHLTTMADLFSSDSDLFELSHFGNINFGLNIDKELLVDLSQLTYGSKIFEGSNCIVFEGLYKSKPVAIKVIQSDKFSAYNSECKEKFEREVTLHSRARHDNIVKFIGASVEPNLMIITELMRGGTLQKYLLCMRPSRPDLELSISFALGISQAMMYLHEKGIIHRDLKPSNMLLSKDKNWIKIADFGLAREEIMGEMSAEAGTYRWMAPELFNMDGMGKKKQYDHKVDVYSFSIVLWELLTNSTPFKGRSNVTAAYAAAAQKMRPSLDNIPKEIAPLLESCWAVDPADRPEFSQINDFLENILHYLYASESTPRKVFGIKHPPEFDVTEDSPQYSPCTNPLVENPEDKNKNTRGTCSRCFSCFGN